MTYNPFRIDICEGKIPISYLLLFRYSSPHKKDILILSKLCLASLATHDLTFKRGLEPVPLHLKSVASSTISSIYSFMVASGLI